jgi:tRNA/rRNA methyltransferase
VAGDPARRIALVFGPEDNGLRQEHLDLCRHIVRIPSDDECPSFNLSHAVLLVLYEITRAVPAAAATPAPVPPDVPSGNEYAQLDRIVESVMRRTGFLREGTPAPVPGTVRSILRRPQLSRQEVGVLLGLFGRIDRTLGRLGTHPGDHE